MNFLQDSPIYRPHFQRFAVDQPHFFAVFARAFGRLLQLGVPEEASTSDPLRPLSHACVWQLGERCFGHRHIVLGNVELGRDGCHAQCHQTNWCEKISWVPVDGPDWSAGCFLFGAGTEYRCERGEAHTNWASVSVLRATAA